MALNQDIANLYYTIKGEHFMLLVIRNVGLLVNMFITNILIFHTFLPSNMNKLIKNILTAIKVNCIAKDIDNL